MSDCRFGEVMQPSAAAAAAGRADALRENGTSLLAAGAELMEVTDVAEGG